MEVAETTGIVIITVALIQGLIGLIKYLLARQKSSQDDVQLLTVASGLEKIEDKIEEKCGLNEKQSGQIHAIYELVIKTDREGMPLVYFPRISYGETQKIIAERLQVVGEVQLKMLGIIERLERRIETIDKTGGTHG